MSSLSKKLLLVVIAGILLTHIIPHKNIPINNTNRFTNLDEITNLPQSAISTAIDLIYSTYFGGNATEIITSAQTDAMGNIYVVGDTSSKWFPVTAGANDTTHNGGSKDAFIVKFLSNGSLSYCTYLGGSGNENTRDIWVFPEGSVIVIGFTDSSNFPTTPNAFDKIKNSSNDGFISILDPSGSTFIYSTYLGGEGNDVPEDITVDSSGNIYVVGETSSLDFPTTLGAYNRIHESGNPMDGFVTKFAPNGADLIYSTYIGGTLTDSIYSITVDASGCALVTGATTSTNFPLTPNATDSNIVLSDAFLVKFNSQGSDLYYSSYIGGTLNDDGYQIGLDAQENIYISGATTSSNFPVTLGAFDIIHESGYDGFVMKLASDCRTIEYSTFIGGSDNEELYGMEVDKEGYVFLTGYTESADYPITIGAFNSTFGGISDIYVSKLSRNGDRLLYSSYIGGTDKDEGRTVISDNNGCVIVIGPTYSPEFPCTLNAFNYTLWGLSDMGISKIRIDPEITHPVDISYEYKKIGNQIIWTVIDSIVGTTSYHISKKGIPVTSGTWVSEVPIIFSVDGLEAGIYTFEITANNGLGGFVKDSVIVTVETNLLADINAFLTQNTLVLILFGINLLGIIVIVSVMRRKFKNLTKLIEKPSNSQTSPLIKQSTDPRAPSPKQSPMQKAPLDEKKKNPKK